MNKGHEHQPKGASVVYWIHRPEHTDITKQGYVGITNKRARERWAEHRRASRKNPDEHCAVVNRAICKYPDLIYEVVLVADTREYVVAKCLPTYVLPCKQVVNMLCRCYYPTR